jgi:hypothetical protein
MTDNAKNDKYVIPLLKQVTYRLDNYVPRVQLSSTNDNLVVGVDIGDDFVRVFENSNDYVESDSNNGFNISKQGVVFECYLPVINNNSSIYFGTNDYGAEIYNDNGPKIYFWSICDGTDEYPYQAGDLFKMYLDTNTARFLVIREDLEPQESQIIVNESLDIQCSSNNNQYVNIGFDSEYDDGNSYLFEGIKFYQSGKEGRTGYPGEDGISLISGSGAPLPTLGNYGDLYNDILTSRIWFKDNSWSTQTTPYYASTTFALAPNTNGPTLFSFGNDYNNVLITIIFARSATDRIPEAFVQAVVNKANNPDVSVSPWNYIGNFPENVTIQTSITNKGSVRLVSNSSALAWNYITTKIQIN